MRQINNMLAIGLLALVLVIFSAQQQARAHEAVMLEVMTFPRNRLCNRI